MAGPKKKTPLEISREQNAAAIKIARGASKALDIASPAASFFIRNAPIAARKLPIVVQKLGSKKKRKPLKLER